MENTMYSFTDGNSNELTSIEGFVLSGNLVLGSKYDSPFLTLFINSDEEAMKRLNEVWGDDEDEAYENHYQRMAKLQ